jgi:DNA helicase HerA-like ATPase
MNAAGGGRLPRRAGRHVLIAGATGSGKTVSARRWLLARILADGVGVMVTDPKGDRGLESDLRAAARLARRPFPSRRRPPPRVPDGGERTAAGRDLAAGSGRTHQVATAERIADRYFSIAALA